MKKLILIAVIGLISISCNAQSINKDSLYIHKIDSLTKVVKNLSLDLDFVYYKLTETNVKIEKYRVKALDDQLLMLDLIDNIRKY